MSANALGIVSIVAAMLVVSLQDALVKQFHADYALHEIMVVRALIALGVTLAFVHVEGGLGLLRTRNFPFLMLRGILLVIANTCFFLGLAAMPLAENVAIFFVAPLLITALSALTLGEPVGPRRWLGVGIGLLGVIVVLRPEDGLTRWSSVLPLCAALAYAVMQVLARRMGRVESAGTMAMYMQLTLLGASAGVGLVAGDGQLVVTDDPSLAFLLREWAVPAWPDFGLWCVMGVLSGVGGYLMTQGYRVADAAVVAPFEYVAMPFAVLWGYTFYAEVPDTATWLGITLIVAGGLYVVHREIVRQAGRGAR